MSKRRTRKEKEKAASHRSLTLITPNKTFSVNPEIKTESTIVTVPAPNAVNNIYKEEPLNSQYTAVKKDLFRTSISIVLALALELSVYYFLYSTHQARLSSGL